MVYFCYYYKSQSDAMDFRSSRLRTESVDEAQLAFSVAEVMDITSS